MASETNDAGAISSMLAPNCRSCEKIATVIGCVSRPNVSATSRSFQAQRNWKIASDAIAGSPSGRIRRRKIRISEAPSMRAASSSSFGIPMKKLRRRKMAKGSPNAVWKRTIARTVSKIPRRVVEREHRDERHLQRDDEQRDHEDEEPVAAGEVEPRERVAGERRDDDREHGAADRDPDGRPERRRDRLVVEDRLVVVERELGSARRRPSTSRSRPGRPAS